MRRQRRARRRSWTPWTNVILLLVLSMRSSLVKPYISITYVQRRATGACERQASSIPPLPPSKGPLIGTLQKQLGRRESAREGRSGTVRDPLRSKDGWKSPSCTFMGY